MMKVNVNDNYNMSLKFTAGSIEQLKSKLKTITKGQNWQELNSNTYQVKIDGVAINYFSTTGTITVQGKPDISKKIESQIYRTIFGPVARVKDTTVEEIFQEPEAFPKSKLISDEYPDSEIVIALVGAVGVEYKQVLEILKDRLEKNFSYQVEEIRISKEIIGKLSIFTQIPSTASAYESINHFMDFGNEARKNI